MTARRERELFSLILHPILSNFTIGEKMKGRSLGRSIPPSIESEREREKRRRRREMRHLTDFHRWNV